jgi:transcriptional regulator with XRE-family HTH domain
MSTKRTRSILSLAQKREICLKYEQKPQPTQKQLAEIYGVKQNTISDILRNKQKWLEIDIESNILEKKRIRTISYPDVESSLAIWFMQALLANQTITGDILKTKARTFAQMLNIEKFSASDGWLSGFKKRYHIQQYTKTGEAASAPLDILEDERAKLQNLISEYKSEDVFNCDETGTFIYIIYNLIIY